MSTLAELLAEKESLDQQIAAIRKDEREKAIADALKIIKDFELTSDDLFGPKAKTEKKQSDAKYRDPDTGKTWSGKGRTPKWLEGKNKEDFAI